VQVVRLRHLERQPRQTTRLVTQLRFEIALKVDGVQNAPCNLDATVKQCRGHCVGSPPQSSLKLCPPLVSQPWMR
jgi:hypothetical protein